VSERQLAELRASWDRLGAEDPLWAILSERDKRGGRWVLDEFFAAGELDVVGLELLLAHFGLPLQRRVALDFGCGVGRISRALATRFENVVAVDISPSMIAHARALNAETKNVRFVENAEADLRFVTDASVDLVYSNITLQHIPPSLSAGYLVELLRILGPGGVAVLQLVVACDDSWRSRVFRLLPNAVLNPLRRLIHRRETVFEMHVLAESVVESAIRNAGTRLLHADTTSSAGLGWISRRFLVTRDAG
jgi:ubiquinone/menaquinone biosynthesis C-methylase UbiE